MLPRPQRVLTQRWLSTRPTALPCYLADRGFPALLATHGRGTGAAGVSCIRRTRRLVVREPLSRSIQSQGDWSYSAATVRQRAAEDVRAATSRTPRHGMA